MKNLLTIIYFLMLLPLFSNGQIIQKFDDFMPDQSELEIEPRLDFETGFLFLCRKKFESEKLTFTCGGTSATTKLQVENIGTNPNVQTFCNTPGNDGFQYFYARKGIYPEVYRINKATLDVEFVKELKTDYLNDNLVFFNGDLYFTDDNYLKKLSLSSNEVTTIEKIGFLNAKGLHVLNDRLLILGDDNNDNYGLYESDGNPNSLKLIKNLKKIDGISDQTVKWFEFKGKTYFTLYFYTDQPGSIYFTNGTSEGTDKLIDVPVSTFNVFNNFKFLNLGSKFAFATLDNSSGSNRYQIYVSDGTSVGTKPIEGLDFNVVGRVFENIDDKAYIIGNQYLYEINSSTLSAKKVIDGKVVLFNTLDDKIYFTNENYMLWKRDQTGNLSQVNYDGNGIRIFDFINKWKNKLFFTSFDNNDNRLFSLEEEVISTTKLRDIESFDIYPNIISDYISFEDRYVGFNIEIVNETGQLIYKTLLQKSPMSISKLVPGTYSVILSDKLKGKYYASRFIKL